MKRFSLLIVIASLLISPNLAKAAAPRILVISDIEGEFTPFRQLLIGNRVIDKKDRWIYGRNQLVICGDLFDRGKQVFEELTFLRRLERKAAKAGGTVHIILGNHDIMNMSGDVRYVDSSYRKDLRAYLARFDASTSLGEWLRSKPLLVKIGRRLFLHGGISPAVNAAGKSISEITCLTTPFYGTPAVALPDSIKTYLSLNGLIWYRGYFMAPRATFSTIDSTCKLFGIRQIVVGHTIVDRNIALYYSGKVVAVDVDAHKGRHEALLIVADQLYKVDSNGRRQLLTYAPANDIIRPEQIL